VNKYCNPMWKKNLKFKDYNFLELALIRMRSVLKES